MHKDNVLKLGNIFKNGPTMEVYIDLYHDRILLPCWSHLACLQLRRISNDLSDMRILHTSLYYRGSFLNLFTIADSQWTVHYVPIPLLLDCLNYHHQSLGLGTKMTSNSEENPGPVGDQVRSTVFVFHAPG